MSGFDHEEFQDDLSDVANIAGMQQRREQLNEQREIKKLLQQQQLEQERIKRLPKCPECKNSVNHDANLCAACNTNLYWFDHLLASSVGAMKLALEQFFVKQNNTYRNNVELIPTSLSSVISASLSHREASRLLDVHAETRKRVEEHGQIGWAMKDGVSLGTLGCFTGIVVLIFCFVVLPPALAEWGQSKKTTLWFIVLGLIFVAFPAGPFAFYLMRRKNGATKRDQLQSDPMFERVAAVRDLNEVLRTNVEQKWLTLCSHWAEAHNTSAMMQRLRNTASTYSAVFSAADPSESMYRDANPGFELTGVNTISFEFMEFVNTIDPNVYAATEASHSFPKPIIVLRDTPTTHEKGDTKGDESDSKAVQRHEQSQDTRTMDTVQKAGNTDSYHIKRGTTLKGPFSVKKLQSLMKAKKLKPSDEVSQAPEGPWERLGDVYKTIVKEKGGDQN